MSGTLAPKVLTQLRGFSSYVRGRQRDRDIRRPLAQCRICRCEHPVLLRRDAAARRLRRDRAHPHVATADGRPSVTFDRTDWWANILGPAPGWRIVVIDDVDDPPGMGALIGNVHGNILRALDCAGVVTNGAVRDAADLRAISLQCFARQLAVSHAYAHIFEFGAPVTVGGLEIRPGDLLHGDRHGLLKVPLDIAAAVPGVAKDMLARDERIIALCQSKEFSPDKLRAMILDIGDAPSIHAAPPAKNNKGQR